GLEFCLHRVEVLGYQKDYAVEIRQPVTFAVDLPEVRIAFEHHSLAADKLLHHKRSERHDRGGSVGELHRIPERAGPERTLPFVLWHKPEVEDRIEEVEV